MDVTAPRRSPPGRSGWLLAVLLLTIVVSVGAPVVLSGTNEVPGGFVEVATDHGSTNLGPRDGETKPGLEPDASLRHNLALLSEPEIRTLKTMLETPKTYREALTEKAGSSDVVEFLTIYGSDRDRMRVCRALGDLGG